MMFLAVDVSAKCAQLSPLWLDVIRAGSIGLLEHRAGWATIRIFDPLAASVKHDDRC